MRSSRSLAMSQRSPAPCTRKENKAEPSALMRPSSICFKDVWWQVGAGLDRCSWQWWIVSGLVWKLALTWLFPHTSLPSFSELLTFKMWRINKLLLASYSDLPASPLPKVRLRSHQIQRWGHTAVFPIRLLIKLSQWSDTNANTAFCTTQCHTMGPVMLITWDPLGCTTLLAFSAAPDLVWTHPKEWSEA